MLFKISLILLLNLTCILTDEILANLSIIKPRKISTFDDNRNSLTKEKSSIASKKCIEYSKLYQSNVKNCTNFQDNKQTTYADPKDFPHMARIGYHVYNEIYWGCMGSLISEDTIITAAHCLYLRSLGSATIVRLGTINNFIDFNITEKIIHPDYKNSSNYNDIGVIKLNGKVSFTEYVRPACISDMEQIDEYHNAVWTGIDRIEEEYDESPSELLQFTLEFFSKRECHKSFLPYNKLRSGIQDNIQFCAGSKDYGKSSCLLYGGPFQIPDKKLNCINRLIGISSFGIFDCSINGYTKISSYINWIEKLAFT